MISRRTLSVPAHQLVALVIANILIVFQAAAFAALVWWARQQEAPDFGQIYAALFVAVLGGAGAVANSLAVLLRHRWQLQRTLWLCLLVQLPLLVIGAFGVVTGRDLLAVVCLLGLGAVLGMYRAALDRLLTQSCHLSEAAYLDSQLRAAAWVAIGLGTLFGVRLAQGDVPSSVLWLLMLSSGVALTALYVPDIRDRRERWPLRSTEALPPSARDLLWAWLTAMALWAFFAAAFAAHILFLSSGGLARNVVLLVTASIGVAFGHLLAAMASRGRYELATLLGGSLLVSLGCALNLALSAGMWQETASWFVIGTGLGALAPSPSVLLRQVGAWEGVLATMLRGRLVAGVAAVLGVLGALVLGRYVVLAGLVSALAGAVVLVLIAPHTLLELAVRLHTNGARLLRVIDSQNVPDSGPVLLVTTHLDLPDLLLVRAAVPRRMRFVVPEDAAADPAARYALELLDPIVVAARSSDAAGLAAALREVRAAFARGEIVCLMNEGHFDAQTRERGRFRHLFWRIVQRYCPAIVPVSVNRGWGRVCTLHGLWCTVDVRLRRGHPVEVAFGAPLASSTPWWQVRQEVQQLAADQLIEQRHHEKTLPWYLLRAFRRYPRNLCMADTTGVRLTYRQALLRAVVLSRLLRRKLDRDEQMVGVILPPSVGGCMTNLSLIFMGKVPVNLNFTASQEAIESAVAQCGIRTILTSRKLLSRIRIELPVEPTVLEDLRNEVTISDKLIAALAAYVLPIWLVEKLVFRMPDYDPDDLLTVIFSSGSTGDPKGVMLTHHNVLSNAQAVIQAITPVPSDRLVGTLPLFHSFGFLTNLWVPFFVGAGAVYHPSPLEPKAIGELTEREQGTILCSTPTFLRSYIRRIPAEQFRSLRLVITGAEKLPAQVAAAFRDRFGVEPLEGYGCTELSPVVSVNTTTLVGADGLPTGPKPGTVGHPIFGVAVQVRDLDSNEPLGPGHDGMLYVYGPNVMKGYLKRPRLTKQVLQDGWYMTGDVARVDEDGFIMITDRLARFSKIGGEMVPHVRVEEALRQVIQADDIGIAVLGVPDATKGERLVVLHEPLPEPVDVIYERLKNAGLPNLWIPARNMFFEVPELPALPTGKLDLRQAKRLALELSQKPTARATADRAAS